MRAVRGRVRTSVGWVCKGAGVVALVVLIGVFLFARASEAPAAQPRDTITHADVVLDDAGLHMAPRELPAGEVELTVVDKRSQRTAFSIVSEPRTAIGLAEPGTSLVDLRWVRSYALRASTAEGPVGEASFAVVVPALAPPREGTHDVTIVAGPYGMMTPKREARREQPLLARAADASADNAPWTAVEPGRTAVTVRNTSGVPLSCAIGASEHETVADGHRFASTVVLRAGMNAGSNAELMRCRGEGLDEVFALWVA